MGVSRCLTLKLIPASSLGSLVPLISADKLPEPGPTWVTAFKFKFVLLFAAVGIIN